VGGGNVAEGELSLAGKGYPTPRNQCWPEQVPFVLANYGMQNLFVTGPGPERGSSRPLREAWFHRPDKSGIEVCAAAGGVEVAHGHLR
jgi:hypothetical protein